MRRTLSNQSISARPLTASKTKPQKNASNATKNGISMNSTMGDNQLLYDESSGDDNNYAL